METDIPTVHEFSVAVSYPFSLGLDWDIWLTYPMLLESQREGRLTKE